MQKNNFYRPTYKKLIFLNENLQNSKKLSNLKKKKWKFFIKILKKKYKLIYLYDHTIYLKFKSNTFFNKKYKYSLLSKQKLCFFSGFLTKKYLKFIRKKSFKLANKHKTKKNYNFFFLELLETRLDITLYRTNFFSSIREVKHHITHGKVFVNEKKITTNSFILKKSDIIKINFLLHKKIKNNLLNSNKWPIPPAHLYINYKIFQLTIIKAINLLDIAHTYSFWLNLVILKKYFIK